MVPFAHLHVHSEYSLLDGACRIEQLVERVSDLGQTSCALTDHGVMYGVIDFYRACKAKGIHPVIGCEVYLAPHSRHERGYVNGEWHSHLILLCENMTGYKNLIHMVSAAFSEGFYMKPRIDMELLRGHSEGLICMSACLAGAIPRAIANGNMDKAYEICEEFLEIFDREHFYLEIQDHGIEEQKKVNEGLYQLAKELNLELVATNDAHYLTRADARTQDILMAIQMGKTVDDPTRMKFETQEFYIKDADEMAALFPEHPEALANTVKIAERCQVDFEFGKYHLPHFQLPEGWDDGEAYFRHLCLEGFARRYPGQPPEYLKQLEYEMHLLHNEYIGELRLGASTTIAQYVLPPLLGNFIAKFPQVNLSLINGNSRGVETALQEHRIDLGLVEGIFRLPNLKYTSFLQDELVAVVHAHIKLDI